MNSKDNEVLKRGVVLCFMCLLCKEQERVLTICFLVVLLLILFGPDFRIFALIFIIFHVLVLLLFLSLLVALLLSTLSLMLSPFLSG